MAPAGSVPSRIAAVTLALFAFTHPVAAQLIPVRTVPVAAGDQFLIFPSHRLGMGGVAIALDDSLLDPTVNPAKGSRLRGARLLAAPGFYSISEDGGGARTIPVGILGGSPRWFGGGVVALQQLESGTAFPFQVFQRLDLTIPQQRPLSRGSASNLYAFGMVGTTSPKTGVAVGGSAFLADLGAVDGVGLLYATSQGIEQYGRLADFRLGMTAPLAGGRSLEAVLVHDRFAMTHEVTYLDFVPEPKPGEPWAVTRVETNLDRTNTWGLHLGYVHPLAEGWRIGGILTGNRKSHPKIPNYELMNIPRDPGTTWAYNLGLGIARTRGPAVVAVDAVYEPIRSHTWALADSQTARSGGGVIPAGGMTVENRFRFANALLRMGLARDFDQATFQLGLQVRSISYRLNQQNYVTATVRRQNEHWMEWTPTWGASVRFPEFELRYVGSVTTGTGRPGVAWTPGVLERLASQADVVIAPAGPLTLQDARVFSHQVSIAMPIR